MPPLPTSVRRQRPARGVFALPYSRAFDELQPAHRQRHQHKLHHHLLPQMMMVCAVAAAHAAAAAALKLRGAHMAAPVHCLNAHDLAWAPWRM